MKSLSVERLDIETQGSPWKEEHLSRYSYVSDYVRNKIVLDIACGTGFGTEVLIKSGALKVFAVDISLDALTICSKRLSIYSKDRWVCQVQDGTLLGYEDNYFDVITSFETIEHILDYDKFISELHRVLRPGGVLCLSTPNSLITNPNKGIPSNPYHVYEFDPDELINLLKDLFDISFAAGQHINPRYGVAPFLPSFNRQNLNLFEKVNFLYWRIVRHFPEKYRNRLHKYFFNTNFYPLVSDYTFCKSNLYSAHVQYYICHKK